MAESALAIDSALHAGSAALESAAAGAWPPLALASFGGALLASWLLTPASARLGQVLGLIDRPDATRKLHQGDIPRSGGIAVALAFYGVVLGGWIIGPWLLISWAERSTRAPVTFSPTRGRSLGRRRDCSAAG